MAENGSAHPEKVKGRLGGGKPLNLFTHLVYSASVKSIPNGLLSFETASRNEDEGHLLQLALNDLEEYEDPEGPLRKNALWTILPERETKTKMSKRRAAAAACDGESPSSPAEYRLRVLSQPEGYTTYTVGSSWGGRYMSVDLSHPQNYAQGANMYSSALWHFNKAQDFPLQDYVTLHNSDPRRDPNFVTFSNEPSEKGQLMQIGTKDLDRYEAKGPFRNDALWIFKPAHYKLTAKVTRFKDLKLPSDEELAELAYPLLACEKIVNSEDPNLSHVETLPETFALQLMQSFKPFLSLEAEGEDAVTFDLKDLFGQIPFLRDRRDEIIASCEQERRSNTSWTWYGEGRHKIEHRLNQVEEGRELRVLGFTQVVKGLEIPFEAEVEVTLQADLVADEETLEVKEMAEIEDLELVEYFLLRVERFTGKTLQAKKNFSKKGDSSRKGVVVCGVSGRLKVSCGLDTFIEVQEHHPR